MVKKMKQPLLGFAGIVALSLLVCSGAVRAADEPKGEGKEEARKVQQLKPERLVPENVFFYISTPDMSRARTLFEKSAFWALLNEEEILPPVIGAFGKLRDTYVKGDGTRSEAEVRRRNDEVDLLIKLAPLFDGQVALAVDSDTATMPTIAAGKLPRFMIVASMPGGDPTDRQRQFETILERYRSNQTIDLRYRDIDQAIGQYQVHGIENSDLGVYENWTFVENLFIYGQGKSANGKSIVEEAVERWSQKNGQETLAVNKSYQEAYQIVGRDEKTGESVVYLQVDGKALPALLRGGDENPPQLALGIQIADQENAPIREKILLRGGSKAVPAIGTCRSLTARFSSDECLFYSSAQMNLADYVAAIKDAMNKASAEKGEKGEGPVSAQTLRSVLSQPTSEELNLFKGEMATFITYVPATTGKWDTPLDLLQNFQMVFALELEGNSQTPFEQLMKKVVEGTGQKYEKSPYEGSDIFYQLGAQAGDQTTDSKTGRLGLMANLGESPKDKNTSAIPFFTAYARVDLEVDGGQIRRFVLLSDDLLALKKAIKQAKAPGSLAEDAYFRETAKGLSEQRSELHYLDLGRLADVYGGMISAAVKAGLVNRETVNQLPSAGALGKHLFPMMWARSVLPETDSKIVEFVSPTGNLPLLGVVGSVAWPAYNNEVRKSISVEVDNKFKQIMLGISLYAADFDRFPRRLSELYPRYVKSLSSFESPFNRGVLKERDGEKDKEVLDINNPDLTNLIYIPGRPLNDLSRQILLYEKEPTRLVNSDTGKLLYHVLQVDGRVRALPWISVERLLTGKIDFVTTNVLGGGKAGPGKGGKAGPTTGRPTPGARTPPATRTPPPARTPPTPRKR